MTEFISRKYGEEGFEVIIKTDVEEHYKAAEDFARRLIDHVKPQTNADRIRAMSDEELAKHLNRLTDSYPGVCRELPECHADLEADRDIPVERCEGCWVQWLRQPAKEDA